MRLEGWISKRRPRRVRVALAHVQDVVLVDVPKLGRNVPALVELVIVGEAIPLQVVVAPRAIVDTVGADVDGVICAVGDPADTPLETRLLAGVLAARDPESHLRAVQNAGLYRPVLGELDCNVDAG